MNLEKLRIATRSQHEATESVMPLMKPDLTQDQYAEVLLRLYPLVQSWECWAQANAPVDLVVMVRSRQRGALLEQDLRSVGMGLPETPIRFAEDRIPGLSIDNPKFRVSFLGTMYVMEGSTLGGQHIAHHIEQTLLFKGGEGYSYFRGYGERTGEMWRAFKVLLAEVPEDDSDQLITAANAMFTVFRDGMQM